jgi:hypothetical protein
MSFKEDQQILNNELFWLAIKIAAMLAVMVPLVWLLCPASVEAAPTIPFWNEKTSSWVRVSAYCRISADEIRFSPNGGKMVISEAELIRLESKALKIFKAKGGGGIQEFDVKVSPD